MNRAPAIVLLLLAALRAAPAAASPIDLLLDCSGGSAAQEVAAPPSGSALAVHIDTAQAAWLQVEERGQDLKIEAGLDTPRIDLPVPPRYGIAWLHLAAGVKAILARTQPGAAAGVIRLRAICGDEKAAGAGLAWDQVAARLAVDVTHPVVAERLQVLREELAKLATAAPDRKRAALARHLLAQVLSLSDHSAQAGKAFERAEQAWQEAGEPGPASAARVARAEDLQRSGAYAQVLALVASAPQPADPYFRTRLGGSRCLALRSLGRAGEALDCFTTLLGQLQQIDEQLERLSAVQDYALLQRDLGHPDDAERLAREALAQLAGFNAVPGAGVPTVRGRTHWLLCDLALRRGDIAAALQEADAALGDFGAAKATRWEANTLLRVAEVYAALGATEEALDFAAAARRRFSPLDAPARVAASDLVLARLELDRGAAASAAQRAAAAAEVFANLRMPVELEAARLLEVGALLRQGRTADAASRLISARAQQPLNALENQLLWTGIDLQQGRTASARRRLDAMSGTRAPPQWQSRIALLQAQYWSLLGATDRAQDALWTAALQLRDTALRLRSPILRQLLLTRLGPLREQAFALLLSDNMPPAQQVALAWRWLMLDSTAQQRGSAPRDRDERVGAESFDAQLAQELLPNSGAASDRIATQARERSRRALLDYLARPLRSESDLAAVAATPAPGAVQAALDTDAALVALIDGGGRTALLWLSRDQASLHALAPAADLRGSIDALSRRVSDRGAALAEIAEAAEATADLLLTGNGLVHAPKRLYVLAGAGLEAVPWAILPWPGDRQLLLDTSTIQLVTLVAARDEAAFARPQRVYALVAPGAIDDDAARPLLAGALSEPGLIRAALSGSALTLSVIAPVGRAALLDALAQPAGWVHVAAHGLHEPARLGYSGVWVAPGAQDRRRPEFLSWLDVLERGANARLVVLNACRLAQADGQGPRGHLNFAAAVSRSGAANVIAALWPVSDTATATWVPVLYRALLEPGGLQPGAALQRAQQRLRESRAFRHPANWAALVYLSHLSAQPGAP